MSCYVTERFDLITFWVFTAEKIFSFFAASEPSESGGERRCEWSEANPLLIAASGSRADYKPGTHNYPQPTTQPDSAVTLALHCRELATCTIRCAGPMQYNAKCGRHLRLRGFGAKLGSPEIIVNRLTPAWRFFPSKRALDYLRGYAAQASSGELGGRWRAGARAVELGGGELRSSTTSKAG